MRFLPIIPLVFLFGFYVLICPLYFQGGDTAELVNAGYHLYVPHPPGYPLYIWLQHSWLNLTSFSTVFFRASLLSVSFSIGTILLLIMPLKKNIFLLLIPIVFLGMHPDFVESTVLPDVFSLHGLFIALILYLSFYDVRWKGFLIPFIFCLSLTNHHTTILLLPVLIFHLISFKKEAGIGLLCGTVICALIYLSILAMDYSHPYSWGMINDIKSIINHFLRKDYGTFNLAATGDNHGFKTFIAQIKSLMSLLAMIGLIGFSNKNIISDKKVWVALLTLLLCFGFAFMGNVLPEQAGEEVLKRFNIMPLVILASLTVYLIQFVQFDKKKKILFSFIILCTFVFHGHILKHFLNLRNDSIIEDYSRNLYEGAMRNSPTLINANSDTAFFGIRYISAFSNTVFTQKVAAITSQLFFHPWFNDKIRQQMPKFDLNNKDRIYKQKRMNVEDDIIRPNIKNYNFLVTSDYKNGTWFKLIFLPLGRLLKEGSGTSIALSDTSMLKMHFKPLAVPKGPQHFTKGFFFYQYSNIYMAQAHEYWATQNFHGAKVEWEYAIQMVKYAFPARFNLCQNFPNQYDFCIKEELENLAEETKGFY